MHLGPIGCDAPLMLKAKFKRSDEKSILHFLAGPHFALRFDVCLRDCASDRGGGDVDATAAGTTALPIGTIVSIQQQQQHPQTSSSSTSGPPPSSAPSTSTATIIGLSASTLSALNAATVAAGATIASGGATITPVSAGSAGTVGVVGTAGQLLKVSTAAGNHNSISILKIGDDIMLKAVKVEPLPSDTGGAGAGGGASSASVNGGSTGVTANTVTVTTIPPSTNGGGHVVFGGKRRHESNEEWISSPSPGSVQGSAPPLSPSPGSQSHTYTTTMSNGYSSPMSTGSYDPYSPNGKIESCIRCSFGTQNTLHPIVIISITIIMLTS
uniref:Uncharacterized protein n=1 Tax=Anopheles atroparvus TaxID=41427 RepID=A0A182ISE9_ANOAO